MKRSASQILTVNSGSSSLKLSLFEVHGKHFKRLLDAHLKGINSTHQSLEIISSQHKQQIRCDGVADHRAALEFSLKWLSQYGFSTSALLAVGHRVVHGGIKYLKSVRITPSVIAELDKLSDLAPLHNPACIAGIKSSLDYLGKKIPHIAVFDTAFHHTLPPYASQYAIPQKLAEKYDIKRYGFHGISHAFLSQTYAKHLKRYSRNSKIITLHLGSGCSITAIKGGMSIDTSMGFTPLEGLVMSTRTGDIDPAILEFLCLHEKKSPSDMIQLFNFNSGLLGLSKKSSDMKVVIELSKKERAAELAVEMFCYRIQKYIGSYMTALQGVDAIIFSGGIGENSPVIRSRVMQGLKWLGIKMDIQKNKRATHLFPGEVRQISLTDSSVEVYAIGTDENSFIAKEILNLMTPK